MRIMANVGMVMNLDKCIGCHTCSVTCKQVWTNRRGTEYIWFNNVETKPGLGYPKRHEDQDRWRGGWELDRRGQLRLRGGGWLRKLLTIFANPDLPTIDDYYEPWTYDYETLFSAPVSAHDPVASARSQLTGAPLSPRGGSNWDDNLAGAPEHAGADPDLRGMETQVQFEFTQAFMFYLPRICEHCLNPSCVASCPSGAMYKREEDGIVLVDQDKCRGWRFCVSGCPYKKVYFNHQTGKAEKCTFCYPRVEVGLPTVCSETCVGRLRHLGLILYDADRIEDAASVRDPHRLLDAQLSVFCNPDDPVVQAQARRDGIPEDWIAAARRSPVYALAVRHRVALPLHPEFRTLPMVWYVPPLSPVVNAVAARAGDADPDDVFWAVDHLRIPLQYLANLLSAGDVEPVRAALQRLGALRAHMRAQQLGSRADPAVAARVDMTPEALEELYRLLAIAKYEDRYVIPPAHVETAERLAAVHSGCSVGWESQFEATARHFKANHVQFVQVTPRPRVHHASGPALDPEPGGSS